MGLSLLIDDTYQLKDNPMKKSLLLIASLLAFAASAGATGTHVNGYTRSNGTYVQPHERSAPNGIVTDNYSYRGNSNPYTGSVGVNDYRHDVTSPNCNGTPDSNGKYEHGKSRGY